MLRAIIFDMGGTLLRFRQPDQGSWRDSETPGIRNIYRYLLDQGHPLTAYEDMFVDVMFKRLAQGWEQSIGGHINLRAIDWIAAGACEHQLTLDEAALLEAARQYARPIRAGLTLMPGAVETLAALRSQGYRVGLISNTIWPAELHLEDLAEFGVLQHLEYTVFSGDLGIWKPNAAIFQHAMDALGATPAESVFIGDNPREDILGAQQAGLRAILVHGNEFPPGDVQPDATITALPELPAILERWSAITPSRSEKANATS